MVVVPFDNLGSSEQGSFALGLTDEIGIGLSRLEGLDVISPFSARKLAESGASIAQLGEQLGVATRYSGVSNTTRERGSEFRRSCSE